MLADSLLPTTFWAEAVSTACYIFNRVRVTKPQNKTPYELLFGHKPIISYIRPFGCHVTILDTLSVLGKFDGKSDEGFLVGYSLNSKAYRVYNLVTKRVEVNLHVNFLEDKPNVKGVGYRWMFDIDYLTDSINYIPVSLENQANPHAGTSEKITMQDIFHKVKKVKKLEGFLKMRNVVLSDSEEEEPEAQGRKSQDDPLASLVQGLVTPSTTKVNSPGEEQVEDIKEVDTGAKEVNTAEGVNTGSIKLSIVSEQVNTGSEQVSTVGAKRSTPSPDKVQRAGKTPMISEETPKKSKEQILQEEAKEEELNEQQKKRRSQVQFEAQHYTNEDWDLIRAKIEANAELSKSMLGSDLQGEDFAKKMVDLVNQRKKYFA
ncbi:retrovirus-related pol polyprotein from transposon TNT 1-94, partial [Tanacetum coccineum]